MRSVSIYEDIQLRLKGTPDEIEELKREINNKIMKVIADYDRDPLTYQYQYHLQGNQMDYELKFLLNDEERMIQQ